MLILTRRIGESVYIGDEVRLTVLGVRGTQVRIGINAPKDIPVHREEIYYKIKHEQGGGAVPSGDGGDEHQQPGTWPTTRRRMRMLRRMMMNNSPRRKRRIPITPDRLSVWNPAKSGAVAGQAGITPERWPSG